MNLYAKSKQTWKAVSFCSITANVEHIRRQVLELLNFQLRKNDK